MKKGAVISNPKSAVKYVYCTLYILYNILALDIAIDIDIDIIDIDVDIIDIDIDIAIHDIGIDIDGIAIAVAIEVDVDIDDIDIDIDIDIAGLKLKIESDSGSQLYDFDYMSAPFSLSLRFVNWVDISNKEATYPHVRLHELSQEDSLSFFMSTMASIPATMAIVLINTQSGYDLGKKFNLEEQGSPVPMLVVTKETGKELLRLVEENPRKVTVKVELSPNAKPNSSPALSSPSPLGMCLSCDAHVLYTCTCTLMYCSATMG